MVRRLSLRCVRTWSVSSSSRTFSSSVPKKGSICPEMWTVRRIQLEEVPAVREVVRPAFWITESFVTALQNCCDESTTTLAQAIWEVKLRSCERRRVIAQHQGTVVTVEQHTKLTVM